MERENKKEERGTGVRDEGGGWKEKKRKEAQKFIKVYKLQEREKREEEGRREEEEREEEGREGGGRKGRGREGGRRGEKRRELKL